MRNFSGNLAEDVYSRDSLAAAREESPLRVLVLSNGRRDNAVAAYAIALARGLHERGHQVRFVAKPDSPTHMRVSKLGLRVELIDFRDFTPHRFIANYRRLKSLIKEFRPDIVNCFESIDHQFALLSMIGVDGHLVRMRGAPRDSIRHPLNRWLHGKAVSGHIACAEFIRHRQHRPLGVDPTDVSVIRPGMDVDEFRDGAPTKRKAREALGISQDVPWIGLVARLSVVKGHETAIRALAKLPEVNGKLPNLLISGIEYDVRYSDLEPLIHELGLEQRVHFISGKVPDVRVLIRASDVVVLPSKSSEAISRVSLESMALGVPVVGSDINSIPEILGTVGSLVEPGSVEALQGAMFKALCDPSIKKRAEFEGPARIKRSYSSQKMLDLTESFYRSILSSS